MKCLQCLLELIETMPANYSTIDASAIKDAVTVVAGDACCEDHLIATIKKVKDA